MPSKGDLLVAGFPFVAAGLLGSDPAQTIVSLPAEADSNHVLYAGSTTGTLTLSADTHAVQKVANISTSNITIVPPAGMTFNGSASSLALSAGSVVFAIPAGQTFFSLVGGAT